MEFKDRVADLVEQHKKILETGMDTCPWCGEDKPLAEITATAKHGAICHDCRKIVFDPERALNEMQVPSK